MGDKTEQTGQLVAWPVEKLLPYGKNPRRNDHAVSKMAQNIKAFGFRVPILAKSDGTVIDGHLRLKGAKRAGVEEVPVLIADDMTEEQVRAFRIAVNKSSEWAEWDEPLLFDEILSLDASELGVDALGLDEDEIERALGGEGKIRERVVSLAPIKWTRILVSIPNRQDVPDSLGSAIKDVLDMGGEVDYGGN